MATDSLTTVLSLISMHLATCLLFDRWLPFSSTEAVCGWVALFYGGRTGTSRPVQAVPFDRRPLNKCRNELLSLLSVPFVLELPSAGLSLLLLPWVYNGINPNHFSFN